MNALVLEELKKPLVYKEIGLQEPLGDKVVVKLAAAALNRRDFWITRGLYPGAKADRLPAILGSDGCGSYDGKEYIINPNIDWGEADYPSRNYLMLGLEHWGTFAEEVAVSPDRLIEKPAHLSSEEAAALPLAGLTAYRVLFGRCNTRSGENVLISGVGGGVALLACQFAVAAGCKVYVTSGSEEKIEKAVNIGAIAGASYKDPDAMKAMSKSAGGFDVVIDSAGGDGFNQLLKACRMGARIGVYGGTAGPINGVSVPNVFFKQLSIIGSTMGSDKEFHQMVSFVNEHKIKPIVDEVFPLKDGNAALDKMKSGSQFGKIVLDI